MNVTRPTQTRVSSANDQSVHQEPKLEEYLLASSEYLGTQFD